MNQNQNDIDRILQLVAYVRMAHGNMRMLRQLDVALDKAHAMLPAILQSLNQPERQYYCLCCGDFQPAEESGPDLVCTKCRLVLLTFKDVSE